MRTVPDSGEENQPSAKPQQPAQAAEPPSEQHTHLGWLAKVSQAEHRGRRAEQQRALAIIKPLFEQWGQLPWLEDLKVAARAYIAEAEAAQKGEK